MIRLLSIMSFLFLVQGLAFGQTDPGERKGHGFVFAAPGVTAPYPSATLQFGGGGEHLVYKGFGVGAEAGFLMPLQAPSEGLGVLSTNGTYHFKPQKKWDPFVTAGYTLLFGESTGNLFNWGVGTNYWMNPRVGLRLEFRDHVWNIGRGDTEHLMGCRIGFSFR